MCAEECNKTIPANANLLYCSFSVEKKMQCNDCKLHITIQASDVQSIENTLISGISKGSRIVSFP